MTVQHVRVEAMKQRRTPEDVIRDPALTLRNTWRPVPRCSEYLDKKIIYRGKQYQIESAPDSLDSIVEQKILTHRCQRDLEYFGNSFDQEEHRVTTGVWILNSCGLLF